MWTITEGDSLEEHAAEQDEGATLGGRTVRAANAHGIRLEVVRLAAAKNFTLLTPN